METECKASWQKFEEYVKSYMSNLQNQKEGLEKTLEYSDAIQKINEERTIKSIVDAKNILITLDPSIEIEVEILDFFYHKQATNLIQAEDILKSVLESEKIKNYTRNNGESQKKIKQLEVNLEECQKILNGKDFSFDYISRLIEISTLSEMDKLNVLSKMVFDSSPKIEQKKIKQEEKTTTVPQKSFKELYQEYQKLNKQVNEMKTKYFHLLQNKNVKQIEYMKIVVSCLKDQEVKEEDFQYTEEKMAVLLLELIDIDTLIKDLISNVSKTIDAEQSRNDLEVYIEFLKESLQSMLELEPKLRAEHLAAEPADNLLFLLDNQNNPLLDIEKFPEEKNRIAILLRGLLQNKKDYEKGIKHSKVLTEQKLDFDIFLNKNGKMGLSYCVLPNNIFLVITADNIKNIYDTSGYLGRKYEEKIKSLKSLKPEEIQSLLSTQEPLKQELYEALELERGVAL